MSLRTVAAPVSAGFVLLAATTASADGPAPQVQQAAQAVTQQGQTPAQPEGQGSMNATAAPGWDVFDAAGGGYRYGPSMFEDSAGLHMYTCSPGAGGPWDVIRYRNSKDGGHNWSEEQIVLQPTPGSPDGNAVCDPGVVSFGGYYYIGYTSTTDPGGTANNVFVARSTSPTGPFEKWNGHGWGGNPAPIVTYNEGPRNDYGAGEPSLVVVGSTLYVYYSWVSHDASGKPISQTRVATAQAGDPDWPASLSPQGTAIDKPADQAVDSADVKYIDTQHKFVAINAIQRFTDKASIQMWESDDGLHFTPASMAHDNLKPYLHNVGLSGDAQGHIDTTKPQYAGYAYGPSSNWGRWNTALHPITFTGSTPSQPDTPATQPVQAPPSTAEPAAACPGSSAAPAE